MLSDKIITILNKDPKATAFKKKFEREMIKHDFNEQEKQDKRTFMMMVCIHNNPEAKELFTKTIYEDLRVQ